MAKHELSNPTGLVTDTRQVEQDAENLLMQKHPSNHRCNQSHTRCNDTTSNPIIFSKTNFSLKEPGFKSWAETMLMTQSPHELITL